MRVVTLHLTLDSGESASNRHWTVCESASKGKDSTIGKSQNTVH